MARNFEGRERPNQKVIDVQIHREVYRPRSPGARVVQKCDVEDGGQGSDGGVHEKSDGFQRDPEVTAGNDEHDGAKHDLQGGNCAITVGVYAAGP